MNKKCFGIMISLLLFIAVMPIQAFAMEDLTVEIPFKVENTPGTVVMEALDGAPSPAVAEFQNVTEGVFALSVASPGDYNYRIYQIAGDESDVTYDDTVYNVTVSVFVNDSGELYAVVTFCIDGDSHKPDEVKFTNTLSEPEPTPSTPDDHDPPQTGDNSHLELYMALMLISAILLMCTAILYIRDRKRLNAKDVNH